MPQKGGKYLLLSLRRSPARSLREHRSILTMRPSCLRVLIRACPQSCVFFVVIASGEQTSAIGVRGSDDLVGHRIKNGDYFLFTSLERLREATYRSPIKPWVFECLSDRRF